MQQGSSSVKHAIALAAIVLGVPCAALAQGYGDMMKSAAQDAAKQAAQQQAQDAAKQAVGGVAPAAAAPAAAAPADAAAGAAPAAAAGDAAAAPAAAVEVEAAPAAAVPADPMERANSAAGAGAGAAAEGAMGGGGMKGAGMKGGQAAMGDWKKTGGLYNVQDNKEAFRDNEWFTEHIIVQGKHVQIFVGDRKVSDWTEPEGWEGPKGNPGRKIGAGGTFALQAHDPKSTIMYKNIRVKPLKD